ncbi:MAG: regulatory protein RecX [Gemmatimonadales bacterium]
MREKTSSPVEALEPDSRADGAVRLIIDGRAVLTAPVEAVRAAGVVVGAPVPAEALERLHQAAEDNAAYRTALRMLERRPFATRDLGRRLRLKGHAAPAIEAALAKATRFGFLDDERFARSFVDTRASRGFGPARLVRELSVRGVAQSVIDRVIEEAVSPETTDEAVMTLARKRARQLAGLERPDRLRRVIAYLARRGYAGPQVRRLVRDAI